MEHTDSCVTDVSTSTTNTQWVLWVDNEIWGFVNTNTEAQWFLTKISSEILKELQKENPSWKVSLETCEDTIKVRCVSPGYLYNSEWDAHIVKYEPIYKLIEANDEPVVRKRHSSFVDIETVERDSSPQTRPPTPRPENEENDVPSTPPTPPPFPSPSPRRVRFGKKSKKSKKRRRRKH